MATRSDIRNLAIVAHVDHGKTTLVDALLWQSGAFRANQDVADRVMDSMDLEREKGITILAKNTAVRYGDIKLNIIDTPGHADFGGEVERGLTMVDGVLLLVDASEGPLPQTRFVLRKALEARLPVILVINKIDRPDARISEVIDEVYELFLDLDADEDADRVPDRLHERQGRHRDARPRRSRATDLTAAAGPARRAHPRARVRGGPPAAGARHQPRRVAVRRPDRDLPRPPGHDPQGRDDRLVPQRRHDRARQGHRALHHRGARPRRRRRGQRRRHHRRRRASPRSRSATRSPTPRIPRPLPLITVDEPSLSVTIGTNDSPLAGQDGDKLTASQLKARLERELVGNVSLRINPTERPDVWEVQGRGELALAVLVELMRREGFEMTVGKPQVVTREIDGKLHEPMERMSVDAPEEYVGVITQLLALRKGRMEQMINHGTGWVRMEYLIPARGLIGFRTEFLTETRGTGLVHHVFDRWEPWQGEIRTRGVRLAGRRPPRQGRGLRAVQPAGARHAVRRPRRGGLRGHDRRRELPRRGPRRQRRQGEAPDQHALRRPPTSSSGWCPSASCRSTRRWSSCARTSRSR